MKHEYKGQGPRRVRSSRRRDPRSQDVLEPSMQDSKTCHRVAGEDGGTGRSEAQHAPSEGIRSRAAVGASAMVLERLQIIQGTQKSN